MSIIYSEDKKIFHLVANNTSYIIKIFKSGYLTHLYWGKKIRNFSLTDTLNTNKRQWCACPDISDRTYSLDSLPQEYPAYGNTDLRYPAYQIQMENGSTITDLRYHSHTIYKGKPKLEGLPATYVDIVDDAETLEIELLDSCIGLKVILSYTVFEKLDVITRSVKFLNEGTQTLKLLRCLSMSIDFKHSDFDLFHLSGAWARERYITRRSLTVGTQGISNARGGSGHQHNPFIALLDKRTDEYSGEAYGFSLVYSGNFTANVDVDQFDTTRVTMGINPFDFSWLLKPSESFHTPEVVMVYSCEGLNNMSQTYHRLFRNHLCRGQFRDRTRPILVNNWEATYFDFDSDKIVEIAKTAKELGIELFVLDDGWFGKRDDDRSSLGDWFVNRTKIPDGLDGLAKRINSMDLKFGLWFEPEMVSPDSELYRSHPDWCIHVPNRSRSEERYQLVLDLSRKDVCDYIINEICTVLASAPISYVKWDMNRHMTEVGSALLPSERQRETSHRYTLGLYRIMDEITSAFPNILFESCSGGGGRFDPGILYYMPQIWTSDDTDAIARLKIQYGTSIIYPAITMGAHVSTVPNHQVKRITSLDTRGNVAMAGNFGYELDLSKFTDEEKAIVKKQIALYKEIRQLVQFGDFYRLISPFEANEAAWMFVSEDKTEAFVFYSRVLAEPNPPHKALRLKGLNSDMDYNQLNESNVFGGDELMHAGLNIPELSGDFQSLIWRFSSTEQIEDKRKLIFSCPSLIL